MRFFSQAGQDFFVYHNYFRGKREGTFIEIGAYNGETFSNCVAFEDFLGWKGLCIEPLPRQFDALRKRRRSTCLNIALADFEGKADFLDVDTQHVEKMLSGLVKDYDPRQKEGIDRDKQKQTIIQVQVRPVNTVFEENGISKIDYASLDVEGAEMTILKAWDFDRYPVEVFSVENNFKDDSIRDFMASKGFEFVTNFHGYDDLYVRKGLKRRTTMTVVLVVPANEPNRDAAVRAWHTAMDRQANGIEFDRVTAFVGEPATDGIPGESVVVPATMNFGQAMNAALATINNPYVAVLGLHDRFFDGVIKEFVAILDQGLDWVGGDWILSTSAEATEKVEKLMSHEAFSVARKWPAPEGQRQRIGNCSGECEWVGPGFAYRTILHTMFGRFPWRTGDLELLSGNEETIWAKVLNSDPQNPRIRYMPNVIGNVRIDPENPRARAEFPAELIERLNTVGIAP